MCGSDYLRKKNYTKKKYQSPAENPTWEQSYVVSVYLRLEDVAAFTLQQQ